MTTYLLDTSIIIDVLNGKRDRAALLKGLLSQGDLLACCAVNVSEVYAALRPKEEEKTEALLQCMDYYEINWEVAKRAGLLKPDYSKKGQTLPLTAALK
jgi:predicted nucleic acid-binding protein